MLDIGAWTGERSPEAGSPGDGALPVHRGGSRAAQGPRGGGGWVAVGGQAFTTCFHLQIKMGAPAEVGRLTSN